jgi:hypothetical protein
MDGMGRDKNDTSMTVRHPYRHEKVGTASQPRANQDHLHRAGRIMVRAQKLLPECR